MSLEVIKKLAKIFDHTNLKPEATKEDIKNLCEEAIKYNFGAVCINPTNIKIAKQFLNGTEVEICTVIGFPLGATLSEVKAFETRKAIEKGANEIDMVINIGAMKSGNYKLVEDDIAAVVQAAGGKLTKVILETCFLTNDEIIKACEISQKAGADFVKTSTGFGPAGAKVEHIKIMRQTVGESMGVKASGGIRDYETVRKIIEAGASRIGASSSIKIIEQYKQLLGLEK